MPMCKKIPFLVPRLNRSGRFDGFDELRQSVNRNVEIAPGPSGHVPTASAPESLARSHRSPEFDEPARIAG